MSINIVYTIEYNNTYAVTILHIKIILCNLTMVHNIIFIGICGRLYTQVGAVTALLIRSQSTEPK